MEFKKRFNAWQRSQQGMEYERNRTAFLTASPLPVNSPGLFTPVRCKVIKTFFVAGKPQQIGEEISLPYHLALDMKAIGKIEYI